MAQKQGGKGKSSSPSDIAYWKRVNPETQKAKRLARHKRKMGLNSPQLTASQALTHFPRVPLPRPIPSVILDGKVRDFSSSPFLHILECDGKVLEISPHRADIEAVKGNLLPGLPFRHSILNTLSGAKSLHQSRNFN